jgi:hypothetical protein
MIAQWEFGGKLVGIWWALHDSQQIRLALRFLDASARDVEIFRYDLDAGE